MADADYCDDDEMLTRLAAANDPERNTLDADHAIECLRMQMQENNDIVLGLQALMAELCSKLDGMQDDIKRIVARLGAEHM